MRLELLPALILLARGLWLAYRLWRRVRRPPPRDTDLRAVYAFPPSAEEAAIIRANRPRLRDIAGWDAETVARMNAAIRREKGAPSFLDAAESVIQDRRAA